MSASSDQAHGSASANAPRSVAEALAMIGAGLDYLNSPAVGELAAAALGGALVALGEIQAKVAAAHAVLLRRFDAADGHAADGYGSPAAWLAAMTQMTVKDARAAVRQMRRLGEHPGVAGAMAAGQVSESCGLEITELVKKLSAELRARTGQILVDAARAGASIDDLKTIAAAAYAQWRAQRPDPDDDDSFDDRCVGVQATFDGAAVIRGNLTPECGAAVQAVLDALGKRHGPEDTRTEGQRFHDALQLGCTLLPRVCSPRVCPGAVSGTAGVRAGADVLATARRVVRPRRKAEIAAARCWQLLVDLASARVSHCIWLCRDCLDRCRRACRRVLMAAFRYSVRVDCQPMSIAQLAAFIAAEPDFDVRWRLVVEFLKEYHQEPAGERERLLTDAPGSVGDERWDVLFAGLAEHLAMRDGSDAPSWSASGGLRRFWFPFDTPGARAQALVHAPAAFRRRGVFVADYEIDAA
jgi:hypothetical protein